MNPNVFSFFFIGIIIILSQKAQAQYPYLTYDVLSKELKTLSTHPKTHLASYGKSYEGKDLWSLTIGDRDKPAVLIVAGLDGNHQAGTLANILMIKKILTTDSLMQSLDNKSIIFIPNGNPEAMAAFFANPQYGKSGNGRITDDDRNGKVGDDGYEDLNKDGYITMMRVETVIGDHIIDPDDNRRMLKTDIKQKKPGTHLLLTEGVDNNKNKQWNEDPALGVNINKNFAFEYPAFQVHAGEYAVSESETRALMDFIFNNQNIHTIIHLGPHNNLSKPEKYNDILAGQRIIKSWLKNDVAVSEMVTSLYSTHTHLKNAPPMPHERGSFTQTAYYHTGNFSFSTPVWWATNTQKTDTDSLDSLKPVLKEDNPSPSNDYERTFLKWADAQKIQDIYVPWSVVDHPDFPNNKVEVGGLKPYVLFNPPAQFIEEQINGHTHFIYSILSHMPTHEIVEPHIEKISKDLYRVTIQTINKGNLPSYAEINDKFKLTSRLLTQLALDKNQKIISGKKIKKGTALQPNQAEEHSWLISGKGVISITSGCAKTGVSTLNLSLN